MSLNEQATSTVIVNGEQAKQELSALEIKAKKLKEQLQQANKAGDVKAWDGYSKQLKAVNKDMKQMQKESFDVKKVLNDLSGSSINDLKRSLRSLEAQMNNGSIKRNTKEWTENAVAQRAVKTELGKVRSEMQAGESRMSKFANVANKYFTAFTAGLAAVTGVVLGVKQMIKSNAELSDSIANVGKTTNLTDEEIRGLMKSFKSLNTRTPRKELLDLATEAGKLGIEGTENILAFVEAGNQIKVALGEDLGEDAIKNIGKMVGVFKKSTKEIADMDLKGQMLAVGSAVNFIGQSSSASENYLVEFAGRLGGVAVQAGIGIDKILGYASALDQNMQAVEMSATAFQQFIMKVMGDPAKFAKLAGIEVSKFSNLLKNDANAAIKLVLKSLSEKGGFQQLIPIFQEMGLDGARAVGVLSSLANNLDKIDDAQQQANSAMVQGTSITNEYERKNNNLAGTMEKLSKNISTWFANSGIVNALSGAAEAAEMATRAGVSLTKQYEDQKSKVESLEKSILPLIFRYEILSQKTFLNTRDQAEMKSIIQQVTAVMPGAVTEMDKYGNAVAISTVRVRQFIQAERDRLQYVYRKDIEENKKMLRKNVAEYIKAAEIMEKIKKGTWKTKTTDGDGTILYFAPTQEDIAKATENYKRLIGVVNGNNSEILRLQGVVSEQKSDIITTDIENQIDQLENFNTDAQGASEKAWENEIKASERAFKQMENELLNSVADRKKTMEQFNFEMLFLEVSLGQNKLAILKKYGQDYTDAENNLLNKRIKLAEELSKRAGSKLGTPGLNASGGVNALDVKMPGSLLNPVIPDNTLDNGVSKYESYADSILNIARRTSDMLNDLQNAELIAVDARYAKQLEAARRAGQDTTALEYQIEDEKKEIRKKYADGEFAIAAAQIITETAKSVAASLKTPWLIPIILAGGAAQLGVANAQREAVRNLWTGGYTDPGNKYEPRGIVHAGEFVANQDAVNNPSVNHFLRMIDFAQKNNTIGQVNNDTINRWLAVKQGYSQSGNAPQTVAASAGSAGSSAETAMLMSLIRQGNAVNASLLDEIKKGIKSNVSVTGKGGIREVTKTYDKLMKNASRL